MKCIDLVELVKAYVDVERPFEDGEYCKLTLSMNFHRNSCRYDCPRKIQNGGEVYLNCVLLEYFFITRKLYKVKCLCYNFIKNLKYFFVVVESHDDDDDQSYTDIWTKSKSGALDSQFKGMYNTCIIMYVYNYIILYLSNNLSFFFDSVEKRVEPWII